MTHEQMMDELIDAAMLGIRRYLYSVRGSATFGAMAVANVVNGVVTIRDKDGNKFTLHSRVDEPDSTPDRGSGVKVALAGLGDENIGSTTWRKPRTTVADIDPPPKVRNPSKARTAALKKAKGKKR